MNDAPDRSGAVRVVRIPTREEHARRTRRIWVSCALATLFILVSMSSSVFALFSSGQDAFRVGAKMTIIFQIVIACGFVGFTIPLFLEQRANLALSIDMGRESLDRANEMGDKFVPAVEKLAALVEKLEPVADVVSRQAQDGYLEKIEGHMKAIRDAAVRETSPVQVRKRQVQESSDGS